MAATTTTITVGVLSGGLASVAGLAGALGLGLLALALKRQRGGRVYHIHQGANGGGYGGHGSGGYGGGSGGHGGGSGGYGGGSGGSYGGGSGGSYGSGSGGYGGGGHYRRSLVVHNRTKRALYSPVNGENDFGEEDKQNWMQAKQTQETLMNSIRSEDTTDCGLKMVCELAAKEQEELSEEQMIVLDIVGSSHSGPVSEFTEARSLGEMHYPCAVAYPLCPVTNVSGVIANILS